MFSENDDYLILKRLKKKFDNFSKAIQNFEELLCKVIARNPKNSEVIKILCDRLSLYRKHGGDIMDEISNVQNKIFKGGLHRAESILLIMFIYTFSLVIPAYAFNTSLMDKSEDFVLSKLGKPDRVIELEPKVTRFIYGETREGANEWSEYFITNSYMVTFKSGRVVGIFTSFAGSIDNDGVPKGFPRLKKYMTKTLKNIKPVVEKGSSGTWSGVRWNGAKYNFWARCINKDISYDKGTMRFNLIDINHIEDFYLVKYKISISEQEEARAQQKQKEAEQKKERAWLKVKEEFSFSNLTVLHKKTKLMWTMDANIGGSMSWNNAFEFIKQLNEQKYAGYNDWRLPTKKELETLVNFAKSQGYSKDFDELFNKIGFKNVQSVDYWSSSTVAGSTGDAWIVYMSVGYVSNGNKAYDYYVLPVRTGQ